MIRGASLLTVAALVAGCGLFGGNVFDLEVGTCFDNTPDNLEADEILDVPIVECDQPHDNEVYAAFDMTEVDFPGIETTERIAVEGCLDRFDAFVGIPWEDSVLDFTYLFPTEQSWREGDREIVCAIYRSDLQKVTGSLQGAAV